MGSIRSSHVVAPQNDDARQELHALGFVDGHEGQQSLSVKFYLQLDTQKGNDMGTKRYVGEHTLNVYKGLAW